MSEDSAHRAGLPQRGPARACQGGPDDAACGPHRGARPRGQQHGRATGGAQRSRLLRQPDSPAGRTVAHGIDSTGA
jgi:hypothetical protein